MAWSPNGNIIAGAGSIGVWLFVANNFSTSPRLLEGHTGFVADVAFHPRGSLLASAGWDHTVRLWHPADWSQQAILRLPTLRVMTLTFSPDGKWLAARTEDGPIYVWDVETWMLKYVLAEQASSSYSFAFNRSGSLLASINDNQLTMWEIETGEPLAAVNADRDLGFSGDLVTFSMDDRFLVATNGPSLQGNIWSITSNRQLTPVAMPTAELENAIQVYLGNDYPILSGIWGALPVDQAVGAALFDLHNRGTHWQEQMAFSPDGTRAVATTYEGWGLFDVGTTTHRALLHRTSYDMSNFVLSSDNHAIIASDSRHHYVWRWSRRVHEFISTDYVGSGRELAFIGSIPVSAGPADRDGRILLVNLETGEELTNFIGLQGITGSGGIKLALSKDGRLLAARYNDLGIWIAQTGEQIAFIRENWLYPDILVFSPDNRLLATTDWDNGAVLDVWDIASQSLVSVVRGLDDGIYTVAFSDDGSLLAAAGGFKDTVLVWDIEADTKVAEFHLIDDLVYGTALEFSHDGDLLAVASSDGNAWLWEFVTGTQRLSIQNEQPTHCGVAGVAFSADDTLLAVDNGHGALQLVDTHAGTIINTLSGHTGCISRIEFSHDGTLLVSGGIDGTVRLWHIGTSLPSPISRISEVEIPAFMWILTPTTIPVQPMIPTLAASEMPAMTPTTIPPSNSLVNVQVGTSHPSTASSP